MSMGQTSESSMKRHSNLATRHGFRERCFSTECQFLKFVGHFKEDTMAKRGVIYAKFEAFGEQLAHCYFLLQERFIADPALSRFWADAAMEELQHNSILR